MPVRRAESLTTLRLQCRAPDSFADSRHQACLVSDIRTPTARRRQAAEASITAASAAMSISLPIRRSRASFISTNRNASPF